MIKGIDYPGVAIVFFCHDGEGKVIMNKRSQQARDERGVWDIGGGGVKHGETLEQALARELQEEYNASIRDAQYLGFRDVHRVDHEGRNTHWLVFDFKVRVEVPELKTTDPNIDDVQWFDFTSLPSGAHSQLPTFLEKYREQLISLANA